MNNEVTIDFNNGSFILENKALKLSASVSVPMLQTGSISPQQKKSLPI